MTVAAIERVSSTEIVDTTVVLAQPSLYCSQLWVAYHYEQGDDEKCWTVEDLNRASVRNQHSELNAAMCSIYELFQETVPGTSKLYRSENCSLVQKGQLYQWTPNRSGSSLVKGHQVFLSIIDTIDAAIEVNLRSFIVYDQGERTVSMSELVKIINDCIWVKNITKFNLACRTKFLNFVYTYTFKAKFEEYEKFTEFLIGLETSNTNINKLANKAEDTAFKVSSGRYLTTVRNILSAVPDLKTDPQSILRKTMLIPQSSAVQVQHEYDERNYVRCYEIITECLMSTCKESIEVCRRDLKTLLNKVRVQLYSEVTTQVPLNHGELIKTVEKDKVNWEKIGFLINDFAIHLRTLNRP